MWCMSTGHAQSAHLVSAAYWTDKVFPSVICESSTVPWFQKRKELSACQEAMFEFGCSLLGQVSANIPVML